MVSIARTSRRSRLVLGAILLLVGASGSGAQQSAIQRKLLLTQDGPPGYQTLVVALEIAPGGQEDKHTHPGPISGYIIEGALVLENEGRPTTTYKAGEAFYVEAGKVHFGANTGTVPVKIVVTLVVEKGKPAASPAP
jgi:quercetin dioxygenase-like cupin family protein